MPIILVVDDSPVARRAVARRLQAEGLDVREEGSAGAARATDATQLAGAIIDVELPDGSGIDLAADLRARVPSLPVAFFTATASPTILAQAGAHGVVFRKPDLDPLVAWARGASAAQPPPTK
jgi:two-component system C4-dicarboxylate transport response regulator DctD